MSNRRVLLCVLCGSPRELHYPTRVEILAARKDPNDALAICQMAKAAK